MAPVHPPQQVGLQRSTVVVTLLGIMLGMFLASLDQTVVGTALPQIVADLGGFGRYTWVATAYMLASTTVVPIVGRLSDYYGRKWFYIGAIGVFLVGSAFCGLSQSMNQLIASRALQGLGAGVMMAVAFISIGDLFSPAERGKYQGFMSAVFGLSAVVGPTLGGFITDSLSWHWVFFINLPLGIPVLALLARFFPQSRPMGGSPHLDIPGAVLLVLTMVPLLLGLSWGGVDYPWASPQVVGTLVFAGVMGVAFLLVELRAQDPLVPPALFRNGIVSISLAAIFLTGFGMFGAIIFVPLFFQGVLGASATSSGSFLTPMMLGVITGATVSGQALSRLGGHYRLQGMVGIAIMGVGTFLLSRLTPETPYAWAVGIIVVVGLGLGVTFPAFTIAVQNGVPHEVLGIATSATQLFRSVGGTLGLALLGAWVTRRFTDAFVQALPPQVTSLLPPNLLTQLTHNPQTFMRQSGLSGEGVFSAIPDPAVAQGLAQAVRKALAVAIGDAFLIATVVLGVALVVVFFLKEIPLRTRREGGFGPSA